MERRMDLAGKVALVTGAARGLGRAMALALAREGVDVAVSDIARPVDGAIPYELASGDDLGETARGVEALGRRSVAIGADVTSAGEVQRMLTEVERRLGGLDILVAGQRGRHRGGPGGVDGRGAMGPHLRRQREGRLSLRARRHSAAREARRGAHRERRLGRGEDGPGRPRRLLRV
jgi:hypothetical protein